MTRILYPGGSEKHDSIGAAGTLIETKDWLLMIDCGVELHRNEALPPDFSIIPDGRKISAVIDTHSHADHTEGIPLLKLENRLEDTAPVLGSHQTSIMMQWIIDESIRHQNLYNLLAYHVLPHRRVIPGPGIIHPVHGCEVSVGPAGHIPGALYAIVRAPASGGRMANILITSDVTLDPEHDQPIVGPSDLPDDIPEEFINRHDLFIIAGTDLTNPWMEPFRWQKEMDDLKALIREELKQKKIAVVFGFAQGRTQNLMLELRDLPELREAGRPVWIDGSIPMVSEVYRSHRWSAKDKPFTMENIEPIRDRAMRQEIFGKKGPQVIVTTAGFGEGGPAEFYLGGDEEAGIPPGLERDDVAFFCTGYLPEEGRMMQLMRLLERARQRGIKAPPYFLTPPKGEGGEQRPGRWIKVRAGIHRKHLSAHSGAGSAVRMAQKIAARRGKKSDLIVLTHGLHKTKVQIARFLQEFADGIVHGNMNTVINL